MEEGAQAVGSRDVVTSELHGLHVRMHASNTQGLAEEYEMGAVVLLGELVLLGRGSTGAAACCTADSAESCWCWLELVVALLASLVLAHVGEVSQPSE